MIYLHHRRKAFRSSIPDAYTMLLLHMDGADASTTFTDATGRHTVTAQGNAQIDTAQSKFGGASGLFDGSGDYLTIPDSDDFNFGTGNFTIDCWIKRSGSSVREIICSQAINETQKWIFYIREGSIACVAYSSQNTLATFVYGTAVSLNDSSWHHLAMVRNGTSPGCLKLYIDGNAVSLTINTDLSSNSFPDLSVPLEIGRENTTGQEEYFNGNIDELRISKGIARWTEPFTPPSAAY